MEINKVLEQAYLYKIFMINDTNLGPGAEKRDVEAVNSICGCGGKISLEDVIYPARRKLSERLREVGVELGEAGDVGIFPLTDEYRRTVAKAEAGNGEPTEMPQSDRHVWTLTATLANADIGGSEQQFLDTVGDIYESLGEIGSVTIGKGHSVQLPEASSMVQWFEHFEPVGPRREGHMVANVDIIHAFPELPVRRQAAIASFHALNDCYSAGAYEDRTIRPIVVVTTGNDVTPEEVNEWYGSALPNDVTVLPGVVLEHDGYGWLFGATATASISHDPPTFERQITPGDQVLLHRPIGGLAMYTVGIDDSAEKLKDSALHELSTDNRPVAGALARYCPGPEESFDPSKHIKYTSDISGPGIRDLQKPAETNDLTFHIRKIPMLSETITDHVSQRWTVPDVTVETNGPIAVVASATVIRNLKEDLLGLSPADPAVVGEYTESASAPISVDGNLEVEQYIEDLS